MKTTRRNLIGCAGAAAVAMAVRRVLGGGAPPIVNAPPAGYVGPVLDSHIHVWDLKTQKLPWLERAGRPLNQSYSPADYAKAIEGLPIKRAVYVEVAIDPSQRAAEAELAARMCAEAGGIIGAAVIAGDPGSEGFAAYIKRFKAEANIKGVRTGLPKGAADDRKFVAGIGLLGELGLRFDLLIGNDSRGDALKLTELCPRTQFILDHCGNTNLEWFASDAPEMKAARKTWEDSIARLAERKNVACKISGVAESAKKLPVTMEMVQPVVHYCIERFGEDRVIFGSNWPVCLQTVTLRQWWDLLFGVVSPRGAEFMRKLYWENGVGEYGVRG